MGKWSRGSVLWFVLAAGFTLLAIGAVSTGRLYGVIPAIVAWGVVWRSRPSRPVFDGEGRIIDTGAFLDRMRDAHDEIEREYEEANRLLADAPIADRTEWNAAWETMRNPDSGLLYRAAGVEYANWKQDAQRTGESAREYLERHRKFDLSGAPGSVPEAWIQSD